MLLQHAQRTEGIVADAFSTISFFLFFFIARVTRSPSLSGSWMCAGTSLQFTRKKLFYTYYSLHVKKQPPVRVSFTTVVKRFSERIFSTPRACYSHRLVESVNSQSRNLCFTLLPYASTRARARLRSVYTKPEYSSGYTPIACSLRRVITTCSARNHPAQKEGEAS